MQQGNHKLGHSWSKPFSYLLTNLDETTPVMDVVRDFPEQQ